MYNAYQTNTLAVDAAKCTGCGVCLDVCPHAVFALRNRKVVAENSPRCMECGACMLNCPVGAIQVEAGVGCAAAMMMAALRGESMDAAACG
jgi:NAD-dependent dihydropyrimidine dehydrogenase PreA subunit